MVGVQCSSCDWARDAEAFGVPPRCPQCGSEVESAVGFSEPAETKSDKV